MLRKRVFSQKEPISRVSFFARFLKPFLKPFVMPFKMPNYIRKPPLYDPTGRILRFAISKVQSFRSSLMIQHFME